MPSRPAPPGILFFPHLAPRCSLILPPLTPPRFLLPLYPGRGRFLVPLAHEPEPAPSSSRAWCGPASCSSRARADAAQILVPLVPGAGPVLPGFWFRPHLGEARLFVSPVPGLGPASCYPRTLHRMIYYSLCARCHPVSCSPCAWAGVGFLYPPRLAPPGFLFFPAPKPGLAQPGF